jgi:peptidyl-prolyl cis-trans isomerase D|tara:strand:- start:1777 stop:2928 length:1152 start_codon:yes stop_codon:yes gene_type:complete
MEESGASTARKVAHILVEINGDRDLEQAQTRATEAAQAIAAGGSFAEVAAQYSDDPGSADAGGDLGVVSKGALPEEMEEAIASLEPGMVSDPVVTDAGVHLIKVSDVVREQDLPTLEELAEQIRADLKQGRAETLLNEDVARLEELLYEHSDMTVPAEQVGIEVVSTDWVSLSSLPEPLSARQVQQALNSDQVRKDRHNSDLIETAPGEYLAVSILDDKPAEPLPLEDVSFAIRERLKGERAADRVQELSAQAEEKLQQGASLDEIAALFETGIEEQEGLQRGGAEPSMEVVNGAFALPKTVEGESSAIELTRAGDGSLVAYQVTRVEDGNAEPLSDAQQQAALLELGNIEGQRNFRQVVALLRDEGDVDLNLQRLSSSSADQ